MNTPMSFPQIPSAPASLPTLPAAQAIVFVEADVPDYHALLAELPPGTEVHVLDAGVDGLARMAHILEGRGGIDALHLISHGREGAVSLGSLSLTSENLPSHADDLATISAALNPGADILLYGCNVGAGTNGAMFIEALATVTGADVAASTNTTGSARLGGDWSLERHSGAIEAAPLITEARAAEYDALLAAPTDGSKTFIDYDKATGLFAGGFFKVMGTDGTGKNFLLEGDEYGLFFNNPSYSVAGAPFTSSIEISVAGSGSFRLTGISAGDVEGVPNRDHEFTNIRVEGYSNDKLEFSAPDGGFNSPGLDLEYDFALGANTSKLIDKFIIYFTGDANDWPSYFNLASFTINGASTSPVPAEPTNTAPTIDGALANQPVDDTDTITPFGSIVVTDPDAGASVSATITLDSAAKGSFTAASLTASGFSMINGGLSYTHAGGSPAAIQAAIRALVFQPAENRGAPGSTETTTFTISISDGIETTATTNSTTTVISTSINDSPIFVGTNSPLNATQNGLAIDIKSVLHASDVDPGQTLTWSQSDAPDHGTLSFNSATHSSGGGNITPGGTITYTPDPGFTGTDTFTVRVGDGINTVDRTITVNVAPSKPGAPDLSNSPIVDTGVSQNDNITNAGTLSFSGTSAAGDSSSTVRVFVDKNANGVYDAGDISSTATVNNGAWTVSGIDVSGIEGGFNVYSQVTSSTGNLTSVRSDALAVTIDRTAPTLAITSNRSTLKAGETATITFTFSEDPGSTFNWNGSAGSVTVEGGTLSALSGTGATRTATFTPTLNTNNGTASITVAAGSYTDLAGNNGGAGNTPSLTFDTLAPSVTSITRVSAETSNAASVQYTVTFDSSVSGVDLADFQVTGTNGATGTVAGVIGSGTTYTVTVNNISGDGSLRLDLKSTGTNIVDGAGNAAPGYTAGETYDIDRVAPTVTSVGAPMAGTYRTGQPLEFTVNFDEAVTVDSTNGTPSIALTLDTGGTVQATYKSGSGTNALVFSYTVVAGNADANGVTLAGSIALNNGAIRDLAGNNIVLTLNNRASTSDVLVDALAAGVVSIERVGDEYTNATTVQFTVTFSDDVTGVDSGDFTLAANGASGTIGGIDGDGDTYVITVINVSGDGTLRLDLKSSGTGIEDSHGQAILGGYTNGEVYHFDRTPPTLTTDITISRTAFNVGAQATVTFTFSEAVKGLTESDVTVPNGTLTNLSSVDGITWTATLTPDDDAVDATNVLTLDMAGLTDLTGNAGVGTRQSANYEVDTVRPHLVGGISISDDVLRIGDSATVTFVFNEAVTGFDLDNLQADNGTLSNLTTSDNITWTATLTPAANTTAAGNAITLNYTGITDAAGNGGGTPVDSASYVVDTVRPALALPIGFSDANLTSGETATVTFTFTEKVTGFTIASVTVPNGTLSDLESEDGITWTATLTPDTGVVDTSNYLTVDFSTIADVAGNPGVGTVPSGNYTIDTTAPALAKPIEISDTALKIGDEATVTFTFNGPVVDFTEADVNVPNGKLTQLGSADGGTTWTAILTPNSDASDASNVLTLNYTGIRNESGNAGVGSAESPNYAVDTVRPTVVADIEISDTVLAAGETATVTFTFNEAVTGFSEADVTVPNGTLSSLESLDGGITWTATLTPASRTVDATNVLTLDYTCIRDLAGNAGAGSVHSGNYAVDTTAPALAEPIDIDDTALRIGETATVTFVFDQSVTGFTAANVTVPNGTLSAPTSDDGITWIATLTPNPGATAASNVLTLNYAGIVNGAGNANSGIVTSGNYAVDTRAPTATVTLSDVDLRVGETALLTISFNEIVNGFDKSAVTAPNGTLGEFTTLDGGMTWSATFTPTANTNAASNMISVSLAGVSDLAGNPGAGSASSPNYAVQTTVPVTPPVTPPTNPPAPGTIDGVPLVRETLPVDPATGLAGTVISVPIITPSRPDDPSTPNGNLADIPLGLGSGNGPRTELLVSLPVGTGMRAEGPSTLLTNQQALLDLIRRIENQTENGSSAQLGMTGNGTGFLGSLAPSTLLQSQTLVLTSAPGLSAPQTILINGSSTTPVGGGQNATAIGLVIDTTALPAGSTLQLNNVDFAAIVGAATVRGGEGRNFVTGDDSSQNIFLGADDDVLMGGGGNDIIGSAGGDDLLDGGSGDDILVGGIGNDRLIGGTGNNVLQSGRSTQGAWEFYLAADGTLMARHETALFEPGQHERLAFDELNASARELAFLGADKPMLSSLSLLYHAAFGRAPDLGGLAWWALGGATLETAATQFLASAEWQAAGGAALSDTAFIEAVYDNAFGRAPDNAGLDYWIARMTGSADAPAMSRAEVLLEIARSAEHQTAWNTADGYLIGEADLNLETDWIVDDGIDTAVYAGKTDDYKFIVDGDGRLKVEHKASGDLDQLVGIDLGEFSDGTLDLGFLQGDVATVKQLGLLYQTVLGRAGDLGGFQWWIERDVDGARLVQDFIATAEFRARYDGTSDAAFVQALYDNSGLDAGAVGGKASWESYLANHTRAELIANWVTQDGVVDAQFTGAGLWVV